MHPARATGTTLVGGFIGDNAGNVGGTMRWQCITKQQLP